MTQAKSKISTFADYLAYDDGTDSRLRIDLWRASRGAVRI